MEGARTKKRIGRPPIYKTRCREASFPQEIQSGDDSPYDSPTETINTETESQGHDHLDPEPRVLKSKLALTGIKWSIFNKTKVLCEDSYIFENPFPTPTEDANTRLDGCRSASRQCDIKETIAGMGEAIDAYVSNPCTLHDIIS